MGTKSKTGLTGWPEAKRSLLALGLTAPVVADLEKQARLFVAARKDIGAARPTATPPRYAQRAKAIAEAAKALTQALTMAGRLDVKRVPNEPDRSKFLLDIGRDLSNRSRAAQPTQNAIEVEAWDALNEMGDKKDARLHRFVALNTTGVTLEALLEGVRILEKITRAQALAYRDASRRGPEKDLARVALAVRIANVMRKAGLKTTTTEDGIFFAVAIIVFESIGGEHPPNRPLLTKALKATRAGESDDMFGLLHGPGRMRHLLSALGFPVGSGGVSGPRADGPEPQTAWWESPESQQARVAAWWEGLSPEQREHEIKSGRARRSV